MPKIQQYTKRKTFCFTEQQMNAFAVLENNNVNVSAFVRQAISEKIKKEWKQIKEQKNRVKLPF